MVYDNVSIVKYTKIFVSYSFLQIFVIMISSTFWTPTYGTSDDWILDSWLNSNYTGEFEKESVFITAIFSISISYLYSLKLGIAWYPIILMSLIFYSINHWLTISTLENMFRKKYISTIINSSVTIIFLLWSYVGITFTATAIICAFVGIFSLIMIKIEVNNSKINIFNGYALILIAYIVRPESLLPVIAIFTPLLIFVFTRKNKTYKQNVMYLTPIFLLCATVMLNTYLEHNQSKEMQQYRTFVYKVQLFSDRPRMGEIPSVLDIAKWSVNNYHMFADMTYFDKHVFNIRWLQDGVTATKDYYKPNIRSSQYLKYIASKYLLDTAYLLPTFLGAIVYSLFLYKRKWQKVRIFYLVSTVTVFIGIHLYLGIFMHNVPRLSIPLLMGLLIILNSNWQELSVKREYNRFKFIFPFFYLMCILITMNNLNNDRYLKNQKIINSIATSNVIDEEYSEKIILIPGRLEFNNMRNPYLYSESDPIQNVISIGNWDTFSPQWNKRLLNLNLDSENLSEDILRKSNILWTFQDIPDTKGHILQFFHENGYGNYQFNKIKILPNKTTLYYLN